MMSFVVESCPCAVVAAGGDWSDGTRDSRCRCCAVSVERVSSSPSACPMLSCACVHCVALHFDCWCAVCVRCVGRCGRSDGKGQREKAPVHGQSNGRRARPHADIHRHRDRDRAVTGRQRSTHTTKARRTRSTSTQQAHMTSADGGAGAARQGQLARHAARRGVRAACRVPGSLTDSWSAGIQAQISLSSGPVRSGAAAIAQAFVPKT